MFRNTVCKILIWWMIPARYLPPKKSTTGNYIWERPCLGSHIQQQYFHEIYTRICYVLCCCGYDSSSEWNNMIIWLYSSWLLHWHRGNHMMVSVTVLWLWRIWEKRLELKKKKNHIIHMFIAQNLLGINPESGNSLWMYIPESHIEACVNVNALIAWQTQNIAKSYNVGRLQGFHLRKFHSTLHYDCSWECKWINISPLASHVSNEPLSILKYFTMSFLAKAHVTRRRQP